MPRCWGLPLKTGNTNSDADTTAELFHACGPSTDELTSGWSVVLLSTYSSPFQQRDRVFRFIVTGFDR